MHFALSSAAELFFDQQLWQLFVSYFKTSEIALERIGFPPNLTGYHYESYETRSELTQQAWQDIEEAHALGQELLRNLRGKFLSEELTATGVPRGRSRPTRKTIPSTEWQTLWPNFLGNWAMSTTGSYDDIELSWHPKNIKFEQRAQCEAFLRRRKQEGESLRKILIADVANHFRNSIPIRVFNEAYGAVFRKRRGRPRPTH
jgi:hypothetical protein